MSVVTAPSFTFRTLVQFVHMPAKNARGWLSSSANHFSALRPFSLVSMSEYSEKEVIGTRHRFSGPVQRRQCGDDTLRMFVTPGSVFLPSRNFGGVGMPQRAVTSSRTP